MAYRKLAAGLLAVAVVSACGSSGGKSSAAKSTPGCSATPAGKPSPLSFRSEPPLTLNKGATYTATIVTNCGTIVATLEAAKAPHTVNSFAFLGGQHFFDNSSCLRLTTQGIHVLQCGDPSGTGDGDAGYTLPEENLIGATYPAGTLAMARTQAPHSGSSQFFLVYGATPLDPSYTPFGHITSGLDVLQRIASVGEDDSNGPGDGHPKQPVVIESFTVTHT